MTDTDEKLNTVGKDIAVIKNEQKNMGITLTDIQRTLTSIPDRIGKLEDRLVDTDKKHLELLWDFRDHLKNSELRDSEHKQNTIFRQNSTFLINIIKYVIPTLGVTNIALIIMILFERLT